MAALAGKIDLALVEREVQDLAREIPDHDVLGRYQKSRPP
jgi:hypothetical protein